MPSTGYLFSQFSRAFLGQALDKRIIFFQEIVFLSNVVTKILRRNTVLIPKFYSLYLNALTYLKNPDAHLASKLLDEMKSFSDEPPKLKDYNSCLKLASSSGIARQEAEKIFSELVKHHQPNTKTMICFIRHHFKASHRLLKKDFERGTRKLYPIMNFANNFNLLGKSEVQMALMEIAQKGPTDPIWELTKIRHYLLYHDVALSVEFVNALIRTAALSGDAETAMRLANADLSPTACFQTTINSLLHSIDPSNPNASKVHCTIQNTSRLWNYMQGTSLSMSTLRKFIKVAALNGDSNSMDAIALYLKELDDERQKKMYPLLFEHMCNPLVASPNRSFTIWNSSGFKTDKRSWAWLLNSIHTKSGLEYIQKMVLELLSSTEIEESEQVRLLKELSDRVDGFRYEEIHDHIKEMKKIMMEFE
jgi:hypothetical protein